MSSSLQVAEAVTQTDIVDWIDELRKAARSTAWGELVQFDGVDALDVLLSPIYLSILNSLRPAPAVQQPALQSVLSRARNWGYRIKSAFRERIAARSSIPVEPADVLLWTRDVTHTANLHPVAQAIRRRGASCELLACQTTTFDSLRRRNANAVFAPAAWPRVVSAARRRGFQGARQLAALGPWQVPPFPREMTPHIEAAVRRAVIELLPLVSEAVANATAAFDAFGPKVLVVGNDVTLEGRAGCRVAAQRGLPTAVFMHGSISSDALQSKHLADRVLVYGNIHRQELIAHNLPSEKIVICGAPSLDDRHGQTGRIHPLLKARIGLRDGDPWILVATSGPGHRISHAHHLQLIRNLSQLCHAVPQVPVVVKLHRKDRLEYYEQVLGEDAEKQLTIVAESATGFPKEIFSWLEGCRLVLTGASTVAIEAMLMDVPVISMDFCDEIHGVDFIDAGATAHVRTPEALIDAAREALANRAPRADVRQRVQTFLGEAFCALDGRSADRGAQAVLEMIGQ